MRLIVVLGLIGVVVALLLQLGCPQCDAAKILALFAYPAKSHSIMLNTVVKGLLDRGHEV